MRQLFVVGLKLSRFISTVGRVKRTGDRPSTLRPIGLKRLLPSVHDFGLRFSSGEADGHQLLSRLQFARQLG